MYIKIYVLIHVLSILKYAANIIIKKRKFLYVYYVITLPLFYTKQGATIKLYIKCLKKFIINQIEAP